MKVRISDLPEIAVWSKRKFFMNLFFEIYNNQPEDSLLSIGKSYAKAEVAFIGKFGAKAYKSEETFLRTYYYYLNEKQVKPKN